MSDSFDEHVRSGLDLGGDHFVSREFRLPDGSIVGYPADAKVGEEIPTDSVFIGILERHRRPDDESWCGGWVGFTNVEDPGRDGKVEPYREVGSKHTLVKEDPLTIAPSLACRTCPSHGFIREGRWIDA